MMCQFLGGRGLGTGIIFAFFNFLGVAWFIWSNGRSTSFKDTVCAGFQAACETGSW